MTVRFSSHLIFGLFCTALAVQVESSEILTVEALYKVCAACHGEQGQGVEARRAAKISGQDSAYLIRQMKNFKTEIRGAHSQDLYGLQMILFARTLADDDIERLIDYVTSLSDIPAETTISGDLERGSQIYKACATCHGQQGEGNNKNRAPRLTGMNDWYLVSQLKNFKAGVRGYETKDSYGKQMAVAAQNLTDDISINDVVAYIIYLGTVETAND